ncbi:MAG: hypothetical protein OXE05_13790 [Chloroflexi bacterium]|nr:hypothetical protein [Chloroflexota bacterium]
MSSLPFHFPEVYEGLAEAEGLLVLTSNAIVLEYQIKDIFTGAFKSDLKKVVLPFEQIDDVEFRTNFLRTDIAIQMNSMELVEDVPNAKQGRVRLKIPRKYRREAATLAHEVSITVSDRKIEKLERDLGGE